MEKSKNMKLLLRMKHYLDSQMMHNELHGFYLDDEKYVKYIEKMGGEDFAKRIMYDSMRNYDRYDDRLDPVLRSTSLEELELKLTIRGF